MNVTSAKRLVKNSKGLAYKTPRVSGICKLIYGCALFGKTMIIVQVTDDLKRVKGLFNSLTDLGYKVTLGKSPNKLDLYIDWS